MRVVHALGWYFPDSLGGTENYVRAVARGLANRGFDVHIAAPLAGIDRPRHDDDDGLPVFRYPVPANPTRAEVQGLVPVRGVEFLRQWLEQLRPDVFHVHSLVTGLGINEIRMARGLGVRVVHTNHLPSMGFVCGRGTLMRWGSEACDGVQPDETCAACMLQQRGVPKQLARAIGELPLAVSSALRQLPGPAGTALGMRAGVTAAATRQRELIELCDRIVAVNEAAARIFRAHGASSAKVHVNALGVADGRFSPKPPTTERPTKAPVRVGYIGRVHRVKGLHVLVDAWRRLPADLPLQLQIAGPVGDPESTAIFTSLSATFVDDARVTLLAGVPAERAGEALAQLDVLCCPSIWFENGPLIALESMAVGTPVIGTTAGAFGEFINDRRNGRLVPPNDAITLSEVLLEIGRDPSVVDRWRANIGPMRTIAQVVADYIALYDDLQIPVATAS